MSEVQRYYIGGHDWEAWEDPTPDDNSWVRNSDYLAMEAKYEAERAAREAAEAKVRAMEDDARAVYAAIPDLPVTAYTADDATNAFITFCHAFNDAICDAAIEGAPR